MEGSIIRGGDLQARPGVALGTEGAAMTVRKVVATLAEGNSRNQRDKVMGLAAIIIAAGTGRTLGIRIETEREEGAETHQ